VSKRVNSSKADADDGTLIERYRSHSLSGCELSPFAPVERTYRNLVSCPNFPRHDAEFVDVPVTYEHFDRGQHFLTAASSLGVTSLLV
jgi:hypothetical protein